MDDHERVAEVFIQCLDLAEAERRELLAKLELSERAVASRVRDLLRAGEATDDPFDRPQVDRVRWPAAPARTLGSRGTWFWVLLAFDLVAAGCYVFFFAELARYGATDLDRGGFKRVVCYIAVSLTFSVTAACIGFLKSGDRTARVAYGALMTEGLCLISFLLVHPAERFTGPALAAFQALWVSDGANLPLAYHFYWSYFDSQLGGARGKKGLPLVYAWAALSLLFRSFLQTGYGAQVVSVSVVTIWFHLFYSGIPLLVCCMVVANYRLLRQDPAAHRRSRWFILCSVAAILPYGLTRVVRLFLDLGSLERMNSTPASRVVEIFVVLCIALVPAAAAHAILRYGMFEIAISRSVLRNGVLEIAIALPAFALARSLYQDRDRTVAEAIWNNASFVLVLVLFALLLVFRPAARRWVKRRFDADTAPLFYECPICWRCYDVSASICPRDHSALDPVPVSRTLDGRYRLERRLGSGGMGVVYKALDLHLDRPVAVKIIRPGLSGSRTLVRRAEREAHTTARLRHPHIVAIYDFRGLENGVVIIVMEFIDGQTLRAAVSEGPIAPAIAAEWFDQILDAVEAAHCAGIVHRDLKPENVLISRIADGKWLVKILDFGIAKLRGHTTTGSSSLTGTGAVIGTLQYMSPEQRNGEDVDPRTDIYALGVMLAEVLTGHRPFAGDTPSENTIAILRNDLSFHYLSPFGEPLLTVIRKSLARQPEDRFQTAAEFRAEIIPVLRQHPSIANAPGGAGARSAGKDSG